MNKPRFTYDDLVLVLSDGRVAGRDGARASVIAVFPSASTRPGPSLGAFAEGPVYTVEFEDGSTAEVHEDWLALVK